MNPDFGPVSNCTPPALPPLAESNGSLSATSNVSVSSASPSSIVGTEIVFDVSPGANSMVESAAS